jgi:autotransporter translocation and assembly factor TamB
MNEDPRYKTALDRFFIEPEAITDDDIATFAEVDDALATKASSRRDAARIAAAAARHRAAMGVPAPKANRAEEEAELITASMIAALAKPKQRIKSLEAINTQLEVRIRSLEGRILELEARDAARTAVQHADD